MKKFLSILGAMGLGVTTMSSTVVSCTVDSPEMPNTFDQDRKRYESNNPDKDQKSLITMLDFFLDAISKRRIPDSKAFYESFDNKNLEQIIQLLSVPLEPKDDDDLISNIEWEDTSGFANYNLLITNYHIQNIDKEAIVRFNQDLSSKQPGIYIFLNFPWNLRSDALDQEVQIKYQLMFIHKKSDQTILGNLKDQMFYWYDRIKTNIIDETKTRNTLFNLVTQSANNRVVTNFKNGE